MPADGPPQVDGASRSSASEPSASATRLVADLLREQAQLRAIFDGTTSLVWSVDHELQLVIANEAFHRHTSPILGRRLVVGAPVLDEGFPEAIRAPWKAWYQRALDGEQFVTHSSDDVGDKTLYWDHAFAPIRDDTGQVIGVNVIGQDVHDRVQTELRLARSERQLAAAQRVARAGSWEWDPTTNTTHWSEELFRIYDRDPSLGAPSYEELAPYHRPEDLETLGRMVTQALTTGEPYELDTTFVRRDGTRVWVSGRGEPIRSRSGAIVGLRGSTVDITRRKEAELALSTRTALYAMLSRTSEAANSCTSIDELYRAVCEIAVRSGRFRFAYIAAVAESTVTVVARAGDDQGYVDELHLSLAPADPRSQGPFGQAMVTGRPVIINDFLAADMTAPWHESARRVGIASSAGFPLHQGGRVVAVLSLYASVADFFTDDLVMTLNEMAPSISSALNRFAEERERRRVDGALRQSEERLRLALTAGRMGIFDWDLASNTIVWSTTHYELFGYPPDDSFAVTYRHFADRVHPDDLPAVEQALRSARDSRTTYTIDHRILLPDGAVRWIEGAGAFEYSADGRPERMIGTVANITDRKRAESELVMRDRAVQAVNEGIVITDPTLPDNPVVYVSPGFERLTGYPAADVTGRNCRFMQGPGTDRAETARMASAVSRGEPYFGELLNYRKDGSTFWNELSITPVRDASGRVEHFVGIQTDVTARRSLEDQLRQAQKMEAIGQLAGGIAHDFNNLLTVINGYSDLVLTELAPDDELRDPLDGIRDAGKRAAALTEQLLAFSRRMIVAPQVLDVNDVVSSSTAMLRRLIGEDVSLASVLSSNPCMVRIDPGQLEQVIMNMAVNARDAMPTGGRLTIETTLEHVLEMTPECPPGRYVRITITDTGMGMTDDVRARSFEPFFTTKAVGKGTGLGLAMVYGIVTQAGGTVHVASAVGRGTSFTLWLPEVAADATVRPTGGHARVAPKGTETILLVEDEDAVRKLARRALELYGYTVLEAESGARALATMSTHHGSIDLLVTDVVMPDLGGVALADRVRELRSTVKVLYVSGYTDDAVLRHGVAAKADAFLQKPYTPTSLARKVREVLDAAQRR